MSRFGSISISKNKLNLSYGGVHRAAKEIGDDGLFIETHSSEYKTKVTDKTYKLSKGDKIYIDEEFMKKRSIDITKRKREKYKSKAANTNDSLKEFKDMIIYEGKEYIVINKPNGVYSQGGDGINQHIEKYLSSYLKTSNFTNKGFLVHRLDQFASGVMVLGKNIHYARTFSNLMVQKSINKSYLSLCQGIPKFLSEKEIKYSGDDNSKFLSGLIRSDQDCTVYDLNMINPNISIINEHMEFLIKECKKLEMFANKEEFEIIDEIAKKKTTMTTVFTIRALAFFNPQLKNFTTFNLFCYGQKGLPIGMKKIEEYTSFLESYEKHRQESECYTLYSLNPETGK